LFLGLHGCLGCWRSSYFRGVWVERSQAQVGVCPAPLSVYGQKLVSAASPLGYWSLDSVAGSTTASSALGACREATISAGVVAVPGRQASGGLGRSTDGLVLTGPDGGLPSTATVGWWLKLPAGSTGQGVRLLDQGNGAITVDLNGARDTLTVSGNACPYHGQSMGYTVPGGLADGALHHIAIGYNIGAEYSYLAVDGFVVRSGQGEFSSSFVWRFCGNGAGNGTKWSVPAGGTIDEPFFSSSVLNVEQVSEVAATSDSVVCPEQPSDHGRVLFAAASPLSYWSLDAVEGSFVPNNSPVVTSCRPASAQSGFVVTPGKFGSSGLGRVTDGVVLNAPDAGLPSTATVGWWLKIPPSSVGGQSIRLLNHGNGAITVDLNSARTGITVSGNACPYHGQSMGVSLPAGFADGQLHHIAIGYNISAEYSYVAIDGVIVREAQGEFSSSFVWRFCGNGSGNGTKWSVPAGGSIDEPFLAPSLMNRQQLLASIQPGAPIVSGPVLAAITRLANDSSGGRLYRVDLSLESSPSGVPVGFTVVSDHRPIGVAVGVVTFKPVVDGVARWSFTLSNPRGVFRAKAFVDRNANQVVDGSEVVSNVEVK
jgi:hypothetical protein